MAENDDLFDNSDGANDGAAGSGDSPKEPAPQGDGSDAAKSDSSTDAERIAFWMSKAQTAEAALNKSKGLDAKGQPKQEPKAEPKSADAAPKADAPQENEFENYMRESVRNQIFAEEPRLKEFGFSLKDISGGSLAEMRDSREQLTKVIDRAESRALNKAFETVGIDPSLAGGPQEKRDFASMSEEEFEKEISRAKGLA